MGSRPAPPRLSVFLATAIGLTILTLIGFSEFGQFTLVLALIAGVLELLPIIGPIVAAVPAILIGLSICVPAALAAAVLYTAIQQLENHILVPKVMGDAVELHPAVMIMSLVVGGARCSGSAAPSSRLPRSPPGETFTDTASTASAASRPSSPSSSPSTACALRRPRKSRRPTRRQRATAGRGDPA